VEAAVRAGGESRSQTWARLIVEGRQKRRFEAAALPLRYPMNIGRPNRQRFTAFFGMQHLKEYQLLAD
jgi:hypothetical protein